MKWIKVLECPYCETEVEEGYSCCQEMHAMWVDVCADCEGQGYTAMGYPPCDNNCLKCKGTGGRHE